MKEFHRLIDRYDQLHGGILGDPGAAVDHKEWHHFCVLSPRVDLIVNFSLSGHAGQDQLPAGQAARVILLVHERGRGWDGDVETVPLREVDARQGEVGIRIGSSCLEFGPSGFTLSVALHHRPLTAQLVLEPRTLPLLARADESIGSGQTGWLIVPRLEATGTIVVDRHVHRFERAPAYHDHNWGHWRWGQDFGWQWGFGLPDRAEDLWTVLFHRLTDRSRSTTMELTLGLWRGGELHRLFRHEQLQVEPAGYASAGPILKIPRPLALVAPERTTDVPRRLVVTAAAGPDRLRMEFTAEHMAQIIIPNETDLGVTVINEVRGTITVEGAVKGDQVASTGAGMCEFLN
jgi:hypothetical protein